MINKIPIIDLSEYSYDDESSLERFAEEISYVQTKIGFYTVINPVSYTHLTLPTIYSV